MPLEQGSSRETISKNIATEMQHGKPQKQAIAIAMREADVPKPAKDAAAHDPATGQFTSGVGARAPEAIAKGTSGKGSLQGSNTQFKDAQHFAEEAKARGLVVRKAPHPSGADIPHYTAKTREGNYRGEFSAESKANDEQPSAVTQASSVMPAYRGRNLDAGQSCDAGISAPCAGDGGWPGRSL